MNVHCCVSFLTNPIKWGAVEGSEIIMTLFTPRIKAAHKAVALTTTVLALCLASLSPAQAVGSAGVVDISGISAPDTILFDNADVSYDPDTGTASICFSVYGLEDQQSASLTDVSVTVASQAINGTFSDAQTYTTMGGDDGAGSIVGDICISVPADANSLVDPIAFDAMEVTGTFTVDDSGTGGSGDGSGGGSVGVVENGFDLSGIMGPEGTSVSSPAASTDPDTGITSVCMTVGGLAANQYGYLRNIDIMVEADGFSGEYPDSQSYMLQASDTGDGATAAYVCITVNDEAAPFVADGSFTAVTISGDLFAPHVNVTIEDPKSTGISVDSNFASAYDPTTDTTSGCFTVTGLETDVPVYLTDITMTTTQSGDNFTAELQDQFFTVSADDGDTACLSVDRTVDRTVPSLGDLQTAESIGLTATVHYGSTISGAFKTFMSGKGVTIKDISIIRRGAGAAIQVTMRPKSKKPVYLTPTKLKFDALVLTPSEKVWVLSPGQDTDFQMGYSSTNFALDHPNGSLVATLATVVPSTVKTVGIKLPSGLSISTPDPAQWAYTSVDSRYYDPSNTDRTSPCLDVKNSTKKSITVDLDWTWKIDATRAKSKGTQYYEIPAKDSVCVAAIDDFNGFDVSGDVRFGSTISVSGTGLVVAPSKVRTTGISKPQGYTLTSTPSAYRYDIKKNKTTVSVVVNDTTEDNPSDLVLSNIKINGAKVSGSVVASNVPDPDSGSGLWSFDVGTVSGDIRAKSSIVITGKIEESDPMAVEAIELDSIAPDTRTSCALQSASQWTYSTRSDSTLVTFACTNYLRSAKVADFSAVSLDYSADGETADTYSALDASSAVNLAKGTSANAPVNVMVFRVPGDIRTGAGQVTIYGQVAFQ